VPFSTQVVRVKAMVVVLTTLEDLTMPMTMPMTMTMTICFASSL
jgi:hypothetical protein